MTAALSKIRTTSISRFYDPAWTVRQALIEEYGGKVLWDPVFQTHFCMACLNDVPADLIHEGVSTCCLD